MVNQHHGIEFHIPGEAYFRTTFGKLIKGFRGFGRDANLLVAVTLIGSFGGAFYGLVMPLYLRALQYDLVTVGLIMAVGTLSVVVVLIPAGIMADRHGRKMMVVLGSVCSMFAIGIFYICPPTIGMANLPVYMLASVLNGVGGGLTQPSMNALIAGKCAERRRKYLFTLNSFSTTIGSAFGMLLVGIIPTILVPGEDASGMIALFRSMFLFSFLMMAVRTSGLLFVGERKIERKSGIRIIPASWGIIRLFALTNVLIGFGAGLVVPWFQVYFRERFGASYSSIGYVFAAQQFVMAALVLVMPLLAERTGSVKVIVYTQAVAILVLVMIPNSPIFALAAVAFIIRAVLMNVASPIQDAFMNCVVKEDDWSAANAINRLCWTLSWSLGTFAAGYIMVWNKDAPFFITAGFYTAYIALFYLFFRNLKEEK